MPIMVPTMTVVKRPTGREVMSGVEMKAMVAKMAADSVACQRTLISMPEMKAAIPSGLKSAAKMTAASNAKSIV